MKVITVHEKGLRRAKILILINTIFILALGFYFVYAHIINQLDNNFFDKDARDKYVTEKLIPI
jgi:hypothetical protein